jgi:hypothetical protein
MKQKLWCCVGYFFNEPLYNLLSLSYTKSESIRKHIEGGEWDWKTAKKSGWKCMKVEVEIKPINEVK